MKKSITTLSLATVLFGQISFTANTIYNEADEPYSVFAADMDNDGDMDVLSASIGDDKIIWYENDGSSSPSFTTNGNL